MAIANGEAALMGWTDLPPKNPQAVARAAVEAASATLANLEQQRSDGLQRKADLAEQRQAIAFAAATGNEMASKSLAALNQQTYQLSLDIENLDAAIAEAERRIAAAEAAAHLEDLREKARAARVFLEDQRKSGEDASQALEAFVTTFEKFLSIGDELRRLVGNAAPSRDLVRVYATRAIQTALYRIRLHSDVIPPNEQRSLAYYSARWSEQIEAGIGRMLGEAGGAEQ
jgi:chromosome segregation ATPase